MCEGVVVDAVSIAKYQIQRVSLGGGPAVENLEEFLNDGFIYMDSGQLMEQEWLNTTSFGKHVRGNLRDWIADLQQRGRIKLKNLNPDQSLRKRLREFGCSKGDPKYVAAAHQFGAYALVSEDPDMFDPKFKAMKPQTRDRNIERRSGRVCRYVRNRLGVEVTPIDQICAVVPKCDDGP